MANRYPEIQQKLIALRRAKNMNQSEVAAAVFGTTTDGRRYTVSRNRSQVSKWERGMTRPDEKSVLKLAELFGVHPTDIVPETLMPEAPATYRVTDLGEGRARLFVDRVVSMNTAMKIMGMIGEG